MNNYQEGQIGKLKLVIWDLDETFWEGTIDDGDVPVIPDEHIALIKTLIDHGIVNSICSKNDKDKVKAILIEKGIWDLFVFPSIDWSAKGNRIKGMLNEMQRKEEGRLRDDIHAEAKSILNKFGLLNFTYKTRDILKNLGGTEEVAFFLYVNLSAVQLDWRRAA